MRGESLLIRVLVTMKKIYRAWSRRRRVLPDDESRRFALPSLRLACGACVRKCVHRAFTEGACACQCNSTRSRPPWWSQRWRWWWHVQRRQQWQGKWWGQRWYAWCRKGPRRWQFSSRVAIDHRKSVRRRPIKQLAEEQVSAAPASVSCDAFSLYLHRRMVRTASRARRTETGVAGSRVKWRLLDRRAATRAALR